jgi:hypothetical protein
MMKKTISTLFIALLVAGVSTALKTKKRLQTKKTLQPKK